MQPNTPIHAVVADDFSAVNDEIFKQLHSRVPLVETIGNHIIDSGGKRLRPLLVLLSANACGYQGKAHITLAALIEFLHTATLLHDDVVDTSDLRRGRATANAKWGNAPSVLVGDFLYARSFQMMVELGSMRIMEVLSHTTGVLAEGEVMQLTNIRNPRLSEAQYMDVIRSKTAMLFEAAAHTGAILAGATPQQEQALQEYGLQLGIAFQLVDDVLDYRGSANEMGKNVGDDLAEGKTTLPLIHAMRTGSEEQAKLIRTAIRKGGLDELDTICQIIAETGALEYTLQKAQMAAERAAASLTALPESPYKTAMAELVQLAVNRTK